MMIGIVGKPNTGKSTFFKAATLAEVETGGRPFVTIEANAGVGFVKVECIEKEFNVKCQPNKGFCLHGWRFVPVKLLDVAGLVPGAHEGKGLGNAFLNDLGTADALIHIVDVAGATNEKGEPVKSGSYDPCNDVRFLETEIDMWFFNLMKKGWNKFSRLSEHQSKDIALAIADQFSGLKIDFDMVKTAMRSLNLNKKLTEWSDEELKSFATELRKASKPIIIAANKIDLPAASENITKLRKEFPDDIVIPCSAESELALREAAKKELIDYIPGEKTFEILKSAKLNEKQRAALTFVKEKVLASWNNTGVQNCLNTAVFDRLKYIVVFPGGVHKLEDAKGRILPDAFLMPPESTAIDFADKIHSDFAKNFIKAINVMTKKPVGRDYVLKHRDVIEIISKK